MAEEFALSHMIRCKAPRYIEFVDAFILDLSHFARPWRGNRKTRQLKKELVMSILAELHEWKQAHIESASPHARVSPTGQWSLPMISGKISAPVSRSRSRRERMK